MNLFIVINTLERGGAERMLVNILSTRVFADDNVTIIVLKPVGKFTNNLKALGHTVIHLNVRTPLDGMLTLIRLPRLIRNEQPDIIHSWLYHSDFVVTLSALIGFRPIVWSIRQTDLSLLHNRLSTLALVKFCAWFSRWLPHSILTNAHASRISHAKFGYFIEKIKVIPNGIDVKIFSPDAKAGATLRDELGINPNQPTIGMVARFHSQQKNHEAFFIAARHIADVVPDLNFILCGKGIDGSNSHLLRIIKDNVDISRVHLLGQRSDVCSVMNAMDLLMLPSTGEGWPNVLGEAMACGVPCVATEVGDVANIIGNTGFVVPAGNPSLLAKSAIKFFQMPIDKRLSMSQAAISRIKSLFEINSIAAKYRTAYEAASHSTRKPD